VASLSQDRTAAAQCALFTQNQSRSYLNHFVVVSRCLYGLTHSLSRWALNYYYIRLTGKSERRSSLQFLSSWYFTVLEQSTYEACSKIYQTFQIARQPAQRARYGYWAHHMVNEQFYHDVLARLRDAVRRKRPELWENQTWMLHHYNTPAHASLLIRIYLAKHQTSVVP